MQNSYQKLILENTQITSSQLRFRPKPNINKYPIQTILNAYSNILQSHGNKLHPKQRQKYQNNRKIISQIKMFSLRDKVISQNVNFNCLMQRHANINLLPIFSVKNVENITVLYVNVLVYFIVDGSRKYTWTMVCTECIYFGEKCGEEVHLMKSLG